MNLIESLIVDEFNFSNNVPACGLPCGLEDCHNGCVIPSNLAHERHICSKPVLCVTLPQASESHSSSTTTSSSSPASSLSALPSSATHQ
jgi:hypothetical protein